MTRSFDWSRFRLGIHIKAAPSRVYAAWASAAGLVTWFPHGARYESPDGKSRGKRGLAKTGDRYFHYMIYGGGVDCKGKVLAARKNSSFRFTFGGAGEITVRIRKAGRYSLVELVQEKIPTTPKAKVEIHMGCRSGWTFFLTNLKSVLENNCDLRLQDVHQAKQTYLINM